MGCDWSGRKRPKKRPYVPSSLMRGNSRWVSDGELSRLLEYPYIGPPRVVATYPSAWMSDDDWPEAFTKIELTLAMKKKEKNGTELGLRTAVDQDFASAYPELYEHLTAACWDGDPKQPRVVSTLLVFAQDGCFKACLRDRAEGLCLWVASSTFDGLYGVLEGELAAGTGIWRADRAAGAVEATRRPGGRPPGQKP